MTSSGVERKLVTYQLPSGNIVDVMLEWHNGNHECGESPRWGYWEFVSAECDGREIELTGAEIARIEDLFN